MNSVHENNITIPKMTPLSRARASSSTAALCSAPRALYHHTAVHVYRDWTIKESAWRKVSQL